MVALYRLDRWGILSGFDSCGVVTMKWAEALDGGVDSRQAAKRFVTGALRRIRIRAKLSKLEWLEGTVRAQRPVARETEEMVPIGD